MAKEIYTGTDHESINLRIAVDAFVAVGAGEISSNTDPFSQIVVERGVPSVRSKPWSVCGVKRAEEISSFHVPCRRLLRKGRQGKNKRQCEKAEPFLHPPLPPQMRTD